MAGVTSFRDIRVWQHAMQLAVDVYQLAAALPPAEKPGLATDLQATAVRIPTLVATGHKSGARSTMVKACHDASYEAAQLETLLIVVGQLYPNAPTNDLLDQLDEVEQMLTVLIKRLGQTKTQSRKTV